MVSYGRSGSDFIYIVKKAFIRRNCGDLGISSQFQVCVTSS